jgi:hypothetical protein
VQANAQNALNRMKILNNFTDPDEVQSYLEEMKALKPLILTLHQELIELNEQQRVRKTIFKIIEINHFFVGCQSSFTLSTRN